MLEVDTMPVRDDQTVHNEEVEGCATQEAASEEPLTQDQLAAIVKQIEFYLSDVNLPSDKKLLKQVRRDPQGFVPVKLFSNFRRVRAITKDVKNITLALQDAENLVLSEDGQRVRRAEKLPEYDVEDIQRRTVIVENLPPIPTIDSVTAMFATFGTVSLVRICAKDGSRSKLPAWITQGCQHIKEPYALVEFEEEDAATLAVAALYHGDEDADDSPQVRHLMHRLYNAGTEEAAVRSSRSRRRGGSMRSSASSMSMRSSVDTDAAGDQGANAATSSWLRSPMSPNDSALSSSTAVGSSYKSGPNAGASAPLTPSVPSASRAPKFANIELPPSASRSGVLSSPGPCASWGSARNSPMACSSSAQSGSWGAASSRSEAGRVVDRVLSDVEEAATTAVSKAAAAGMSTPVAVANPSGNLALTPVRPMATPASASSSQKSASSAYSNSMLRRNAPPFVPAASPVSTPGSAGSQGELPAVHMAKGPDGTRGFMGRGRNMAA